jgi:two-component system sensor histidine kinase KdpD
MGTSKRYDWTGHAAAVGVVAVATAVGWPLYHRVGLSDTNVLMLYLLGVLWVATRFSRGAAVLASVLGVLAFDLVFVPPFYRFDVHDREYLVTFAVMLVTALTIGTLTHRVRARAAEARAAWQVAETESLRSTLLSGVSHDLRTPLAAITGSVSALIEMGDRAQAETRAEMLDTIYGEADRMERLITNLLDMTRLDSGGLVVRKEWQHLADVVGAALRQVDRRLAGRAVHVRVPADLPLVQVDDVAIEQVLVNLIDNAVEYTPAGTPIEIGAAAEDGRIVVDVADRGPGVPAGTEGRVFEKFFRAGTSAARRRGIGLGLAVCRGIVTAHGGTIGVSNRPDGGARFRFTLPRTGPPPAVDSSA